MQPSRETIKVALLGLGKVGEAFAEEFLGTVYGNGLLVDIVAVADKNIDTPVALGFAHNEVPVYSDPLQVLELGEQIDVIFDLTGDAELAEALEKGLKESGNHHTLIAPMIYTRLLWNFLDASRNMITDHRHEG